VGLVIFLTLPRGLKRSPVHFGEILMKFGRPGRLSEIELDFPKKKPSGVDRNGSLVIFPHPSSKV
jgi:hypothetical protein